MSKKLSVKANKVGAGKTASSSTPRRRKSPAKPPATVLEPLPEQTLVPYDENLLERARTQWQFGDWQSLAQLNRDTLQHHPDRAKLALLAAAGRLQIGQDAEAREFIRLALDWGVNRKLLTQILISGVYNSLGRAAAHACQQTRALKHFESAVRIGALGGDMRLLTQARINEQLRQLKYTGYATQLPCEVSMTDSLVTYAAYINLILNGSRSIYLGLNPNRSSYIKALPEAVECQTENGAPLYLVSTENGDFERPARINRIPLKAGGAYLITGKIDHKGGTRPVIWIFQYAHGKKISAESIVTDEKGLFKHGFTTKPDMESFAIGIRVAGKGIFYFSSSFVVLHEDSAEEKFATRLEEGLKKIQQAQKKEVDRSMKQIESCIRLQHYLGDIVLPDLHNWSISPDFGVLLISLVEQNDYDLVIEFGSGTSTLVLAKALEKVSRRAGRQPSHLLSFDHLPEYQRKTQKILTQAGLSAHVSVILAPLVTWHDQDGASYLYYACGEALSELRKHFHDTHKRVLVVVDGPPAATGRHARYPAMPHVLEKFPPNRFDVHFVLDDYVRSEEQEIVARWLQVLHSKMLPVHKTEFNNLEKKACLIEVFQSDKDES